MNVLLTGGGGMLARALAAELTRQGDTVRAPGRRSLDVTDERAVEEAITGLRPDAVVQCAAYTAVDAAEGAEEAAMLVNARATGFVARACQKVGSVLVYPSTDYVFSGGSTAPYRPSDPTSPLGAYGRSKLAGEDAAREAGCALIVRTSWLYGPGGRNFVDAISRLARERETLEVVDDQVGRPTCTATLAAILVRLLRMGALGTFHATDGGEPVTWWRFAREIVRLQGLDVALEAVPTSAFPRSAPRPSYSVLDCSETEAVLGHPLPDWRRPLARYLAARGALEIDAPREP